MPEQDAQGAGGSGGGASDAASAALRAAQDAIAMAQAAQSAPAKAEAAGGGSLGGGASSDDVVAAAMAEAMAEEAALKASSGLGGAQRFEPPDLGAGSMGEVPKGMELLADVALQVKIELGRTRMLVEDVLRLSEGSVVELDKLAGDPVDVYVNDRPVARGEVLVLNDNFCVRINEIITSGALTKDG
jgi:flagellar motor switch protein FliN/FliY